MDVAPSSRVEWRAVVSYTGTRTDLLGLGSIHFQPNFSNADNTGTGAQTDQVAPWRNAGVTGNGIAGTIVGRNADGSRNLDEVNGADPLATGYGRVTYGAVSTNTSNMNVLTTFRHGGDASQSGAPAGAWLRVAGNYVSEWPLYPLDTTSLATVPNLNRIKRGVIASQAPVVNALNGLTNTFWVGGTQELVIFRGAITLSDLADTRELILSSEERFLDRVGLTNNADDRRFMTWQDALLGTVSTIGYRSGVNFVPAVIAVPTPGGVMIAGVVGAIVLRRRRRTA